MIFENNYKIANSFELTTHPDFSGGLLNIEISGGCNEKCIYCNYSAAGLHKTNKFIDSDFFYRITKEAKELGIKRAGLYLRGEPLLNANIYDYVDYLKHELDYEYVYISTNGLLLNKNNIAKLANSGIDSIKFSVAGYDRESFIAHHGIDAFDVVNENIKYAYEYKLKNNCNYWIGLFFLTSKFNIHKEKEMLEYYSNYCDEVLVDSVSDVGFPVVNGLSKYVVADIHNDIISKKLPCPQLFNRICIDEEGYLLTCCNNIDGFTRVIDIKDISLYEGVYSHEMESVRKRHIDKNIKGTICNLCLNRVQEIIHPFSDKLGIDEAFLPHVEYENEIKKRFGII